MTYGCGSFIILVSASASADPNRNESASESYHAKGKATCLRTYTPQSRYKCVDRKALAKCAPVVPRPKDTRKGDIQV
jgi:hypothetical protein